MPRTEVVNLKRLREQSWTRPMIGCLCTGHLAKPVANKFAYLIAPCLVDALVIVFFCSKKVRCMASNINLWAQLRDLELILSQNFWR
jgi:hypothetical protein